MTYLKVRWYHHYDDEPIEIYSELSLTRWELRKIEVFADGTMLCADRNQHYGTCDLSLEPIPAIDAINEDTQFYAVAISRELFEQIWLQSQCAHGGN